jgi:uncharacterized protein YkwD
MAGNFLTASARIGAVSFVALLLSPDAGAQQLDIGINPVNFQVYIWRKTNEYRTSQVQPALRVPSYTLRKAAQGYAEFLARTNQTGHNADGSDPGQRIKAAGYDACFWAENVYNQWDTPNLVPWQKAADGAMKSWRESPPHEANLKNPKAKQLGVGVAAWKHEDKNYYKVVQVFGDDCKAPPPKKLRKPS